MAGESMMIAPVYKQNAAGRYVYLPEEMKLYRMRSTTSMDTEILPAGHHYVKAELNEVLVFLRPDHLVPFAKGGCNVEELKTSSVNLLHFVRTKASYDWYDDDGYTKNMDMEQGITRITAASDGAVTLSGRKQCDCRLI